MIQGFFIRITDLLASVLALIILFPILIPIMVLLKFTGEGEVFYRQKRVGVDGLDFGVFKFATMLRGSAAMDSGELTIYEDRRGLPVGRYLRKTKINELPQLINVILGQMSLVGPRPQPRTYFAVYSSEAQSIICSIRPGLSGIGSLVFRDEEDIFRQVQDPIEFDKAVINPHKADLEMWYARNRSYVNYLKLIGLTIFAVVLPKIHFYKYTFKRLPIIPKELEAYL